MKRKLMAIISLVLMVSLLVCGCSSGSSNDTAADDSAQAETTTDEAAGDEAAADEAAAEETSGEAISDMNIMFVVTGNLGGGTNNDDVYSALTDYTEANGGSVSTYECNMDTSVYETTLMQAAQTGEFDLIVTGFGTMIEALQNTAAAYPDQKFLIFDTEMDFTDGKNPNVISVQVLQNEACFLAGALAAMMTTSTDCEYANEDKVVGFVGALESTAVLDSLVSYIEGVKYIDTSIEVLYSFVGDHTDSALTKEMALSQNNSGADVVFGVTNSDLAVADAALDNNFYAICSDADEAANIAATSEETAQHIVTSVIKAYYNMVYPIVEEIGNGTAQWGTHMKISMAEGGASLADNEYYQAIVTDDMKATLDEISAGIASGEITVSTAYGASTEEIEEIEALAAPY